MSKRELIARVGDLESERDTYRTIAVQAIHTLHDVTRERDRLRRRVAELCEERRAELVKRAAA